MFSGIIGSQVKKALTWLLRRFLSKSDTDAVLAALDDPAGLDKIIAIGRELLRLRDLLR